MKKLKVEKNDTRRWRYLQELTSCVKEVMDKTQHPLRILSHTYGSSNPQYGNTDATATVLPILVVKSF